MADNIQSTSGADIPKEAALAAAYQVTARLLTNEGQLLWRRLGIFVAQNGIVVTALHFLPSLPHGVPIVVSLLGVVYSVCSFFSFGRMWTYHRFYIGMMQEQEQALRLGELGVKTRGRTIAEGGKCQAVGGLDVQFSPTTLIFRAKFLADMTIFGVALVYAIYFVYSVFLK